MAVYSYSGRTTDSEPHHIRGTVVARDKVEAYDRVRHLGMSHIHLHQLEGIQATVQEWLSHLGFRPQVGD